jgi:hypothetical protein
MVVKALLARSIRTQERRYCKRYELRLPAQVWRRRGPRCSVVTLNISSLGVLFLAEGGTIPDLEPNDTLWIEIELTNADAFSTQVILRAAAFVVRTTIRPMAKPLIEIAARFRKLQVVRRPVVDMPPRNNFSAVHEAR